MALTKVSLVDLNAGELILDLDADTSITSDTDDTIHFKIGGSDEITITGTALSPSTSDGNALGTSALEWSDLFLADGAVINFGDDQDVSLTHVADTGLLLSSTDQLQFGDSGTYIHQSADGVLDLVSDTEIEINATTIDVNGNLDVSGTIVGAGALTAATSITVGSAVLTEAELETLDGITVGTAIASKVVTTDANIDTTGQRNLTITGELDAATGDFSGDVDIDGTANLDTVDIDGATQIDATVTVGVDDTGYDVKFFGATSGAHLLWDESVDDLILAGAARVVVPEGNLVLGSTAVTSTAAELNLLDGVSGLVQADLTKLAAVDSTAAELNIVDGGTSATSTTVADADRVVMNDNGTMVQVAVTDLAAYFDDEITAMPNLVTTAATTVGALDSGSITSGFTSIDVGAGAITTTGTGTIGNLVVDDVAVNGKVITMTGSTDDTFTTTVGTNGATSLVTVDTAAAAANLTITADGTVGINSTGDMTLDSSADIILDADAADVHLKDNGVHYGSLTNDSSDFLIRTQVNDKDLIFKGIDNSSVITALTLDMSAAGAATFNSTVTTSTGLTKTVGKETIWVPATAMTPTVSNGCASLATVETTAGRPDMQVLDFDKDSDEHAQFTVAFPKSWNAGTVTFQAFWSSIAATTGVSWALQGVAFADNDSINTFYGTAVVVDDSAQGATLEVCVTPESGAVTIQGSPGDNELTFFRIFRDVSDSNDDMAGDARLHGIKLFFTTDASNDA